MHILEIDIVFIKIIQFLGINDFVNLGMVNKKFKNKYDNDKIWKNKMYDIINLDCKIESYKKQFILNYLSKSSNICSLCYKYIYKDFYILYHDCNYGFKKCVLCSDTKKCKCSSKLSTYHSNCVIKKNNNCIICPLCNYPVNAYNILINI